MHVSMFVIKYKRQINTKIHLQQKVQKYTVKRTRLRANTYKDNSHIPLNYPFTKALVTGLKIQPSPKKESIISIM